MIVLFGSTGDLAKRKLLPAINKLVERGIFNRPVICVGRRELDTSSYLDFIGLKGQPIAEHLHYFRVDFNSCQMTADNSCDCYRLKQFILTEEREHGVTGRLFYLAIPQKLFQPVIKLIDRFKLKGRSWARVVFEKPFGSDLKTATSLNKYVSQIFPERDIYRIDHFLGKELVQNILALRFSNTIFEQSWNKGFVDSVQIILDESNTVGSRGGYYDRAGAIRDMIQNHALQILSLIAMQPPRSIKSADIIARKVEVLKHLRPVRKKDIIVGQYDGYLKEDQINSQSQTESFVALKLFIDDAQWKDVPFYIRTGKGLGKDLYKVNVVLKDVSCKLFKGCAEPNVICIKIKPEEGVTVKFNAKLPGHGLKLTPVKMDFCHDCLYESNTPEAYELLLHEVLLGNKALFTSWPEVKYSWRFIDDLISKKLKPIIYQQGSNGPKEADKLLSKDGRQWLFTY